ncbi:hypothetical protein [Geobacillus stearothermophilus]|uniref:hypothetical protein n=1 Tax=Geobacillus stearothermophilus TaxID=1422 RepID=UPI000518FFD6|nr:hypothetical protein [Geobacillus stearothermophilus]MED4332665.1 hypothetical protein [Geobacillus stearothermophilus]MED4996150.1 hypothetical protein [Geobacillus stearothermophilus]
MFAKIDELKQRLDSLRPLPLGMNRLFSWYETNQYALHPIELADRFHFQLVSIYTFHNHAIKGTMTKKAKAMYPTYRIHRGNPHQSRASRFIAPPAAIRSNCSAGEKTPGHPSVESLLSVAFHASLLFEIPS